MKVEKQYFSIFEELPKKNQFLLKTARLMSTMVQMDNSSQKAQRIILNIKADKIPEKKLPCG